MNRSDKISFLAPDIFVNADKQKQKAKETGRKIYNFGVCEPVRPAPKEAVDALIKEAQKKESHQYPPFRGLKLFREHMADWYKARFNVSIDAKHEVLPLLGSKEGIFDICTTYLRQRDLVLVCDPGYPPYHHAAFLAGGDIYHMPLTKENQYLPDFKSIPLNVLKQAKLMFLNYPHNPTGAMAPDWFIEEAIQFAKKHGILLCYDNAFVELTLYGNVAKSILEFDGAKEVAIEFTTFSKTYSMGGWRIGAVVGNRYAIDSLFQMYVKAHSSVFEPIQHGAAAVLREVWPTNYINTVRSEYQEMIDYALEKFNEIGWKVNRPEGTTFLWVPVPEGFSSSEFAEVLYDKYAVLVCPGIGFGELGEGYIRVSLTCSYEDCVTGIHHLCEALQSSKK